MPISKHPWVHLESVPDHTSNTAERVVSTQGSEIFGQLHLHLCGLGNTTPSKYETSQRHTIGARGAPKRVQSLVAVRMLSFFTLSRHRSWPTAPIHEPKTRVFPGYSQSWWEHTREDNCKFACKASYARFLGIIQTTSEKHNRK